MASGPGPRQMCGWHRPPVLTCHPHITLRSSNREGGGSDSGIQSPRGSSSKDPRPLLVGEDWLILVS